MSYYFFSLDFNNMYLYYSVPLKIKMDSPYRERMYDIM